MTATISASTAQAQAPQAQAPKAPPPPRNGIDTPKLFATIDLVRSPREFAAFQVRAKAQ